VTPAEIAEALAGSFARALGEGVAAAIEAHDLDAGYARMLEKLSDERLARKTYPDGRYVPPEG
jgi:hypothetical protein